MGATAKWVVDLFDDGVWTPEVLARIPDEVLLSEAQRRRAKKRKSYSGGVFWKKHNPDVAGCRCVKCMKERE